MCVRACILCSAAARTVRHESQNYTAGRGSQRPSQISVTHGKSNSQSQEDETTSNHTEQTQPIASQSLTITTLRPKTARTKTRSQPDILVVTQITVPQESKQKSKAIVPPQAIIPHRIEAPRDEAYTELRQQTTPGALHLTFV